MTIQKKVNLQKGSVSVSDSVRERKIKRLQQGSVSVSDSASAGVTAAADGKADMIQSLSNAMMRHLKVFSACCLTGFRHQ
jgi:hypothetical protein